MQDGVRYTAEVYFTDGELNAQLTIRSPVPLPEIDGTPDLHELLRIFGQDPENVLMPDIEWRLMTDEEVEAYRQDDD
ncbi:MAG: hypothetical protein KDJ29_19900 [Hyphomicrobiales bacterium]|nr:hypothetical protein [Hyphomicrobiales bacterium]